MYGMDILDEGQCWIRLDEGYWKLRKLKALLPVVERWIADKDPRVITSNYWGICMDAPGENVVVNLTYEDGVQGGYEGEELLVNYYDVMEAFPELRQLFVDLELQPYLGKNSIGNWGIHRHCYNPTSRWNLVMLGEGNDGGAGIFFKNDEEGCYPVEPTYEYVVDYLAEGISLQEIERCSLETGRVFTIDTWNWHSHLTHDPDHKAVAWLMHFKFANSKDNVKDVIRHQDVWGWKKVLWRCTKQQKYRHGTHDV